MTSSNESPVLEKEVGERLKSYRVDCGLEIAELAVRTRIAARYISALEEGQFQIMPGPVFVRGFVRSLCRELGRDPEALIAILDGPAKDEPLEEPDQANGGRRSAPLLLSGTVLLALVIGGVLIHGKGNDRGEGEALSPVPAVRTVPEQGQGASLQDPQAVAEMVREMDLLIRAIDKTWLRIQIDSADPWETMMKPGDEISLKATDRVTLFIGNAGGVLFELNGKRFGPPGGTGQVISNYTITMDDL